MKIIRVHHRDQSANRVFQLLLAMRLAGMAPGARVVGYDLGIFGVRDGAPRIPRQEKAIRISGGHSVDLTRIAWYLNTGVVDDLTLHAYGLRMEYLPGPAKVRKLLGLDVDEQASDDCLCLHVRGGDVMEGSHHDYWPLPIAHYRAVIAESGLRPVFIGQLDESDYCQALRTAFPDAEFVPPGEPLDDFRRLMRGRHVAPAISTFSWLAAWLSPAAERIFLPVAGLLHPRQRPDIDLLPLDDQRYRFRALPPRKFMATPEEFRALIEQPDGGGWVSLEEVRGLILAGIDGRRADFGG